MRAYYLRRDSPPLEQRADGTLKEGQKYLAAPGSYNQLFLPPGVQTDWLADPSLPLIIAEGPKKTLALHDLMWRAVGDSAERPRALVVGISGAWNFRGKKGKRTGPKGEDEIVKGLINDFDNFALKHRAVTLVPDADVQTNQDVKIARLTFAKQLRERGARPFFVDIPLDLKLKGIDDVIGVAGPDKALELINAAYDPKRRNGSVSRFNPV